MATEILLTFVNLFVFVFNILLLIRVLMSWVNPMPTGGIARILYELTEPILAPIRKVLPKGAFFDFSPLIAFILLQALAELARIGLAS